MIADPIVTEVHDIREKLAARFNYDVQAIFAGLRETESQFGNRLVHQPEKPSNALNPIDEIKRIDDRESNVSQR